ncbi:MAG: TerC family protein [Deltaproteobacteria bacterium]|nr:TerC family protein [Deltaproteobacteria bacterium]
MSWLAEPEAWIALATLTAIEIVLGIDNIIFISILAGKLPPAQRARARTVGLGLAMFARIALLLSLTWIMRLTTPLMTILGNDISGRDLILIGGGLFLLGKSTVEIHDNLEGQEHHTGGTGRAGFSAVIFQILIMDVIFSLDSVITAIGLAQQISVMVLAIVIAVGVMMFSARAISEFIDAHPTLKVLALSFLLLIGVALMGEGFDLHIPKGYIYFAMAFSVGVEMLNMRLRGREARPVRLRRHIPGQAG